jgi:hypothetical protein
MVMKMPVVVVVPLVLLESLPAFRTSNFSELQLLCFRCLVSSRFHIKD